ncbi:hypothetical protein Pint_07343 [Pistacia integerrima]|uniref:Uncharacterized protein n=1 Tax=Pistacia integerrima TaxID=434235 RepID=A0ACC0XVX7_9ROSI|nr:hypothetical protein Pint_07343 [Pistacia integerrima]
MATTSLRLCHEKVFEKTPSTSLCLPGSKIPDWFSYQSSGSSITIVPPQHLCEFQSNDNHWDHSIFGLNLSVTGRWPITFIDSDHIVLGYSPVRVLKGDYTTASFKFRPSIYGYKGPVKGCKVKCCGVSLLYTQPNVIQLNLSVEKWAPRMTLVDHIKTRKRHDDHNPEQINTNGSRSGGTYYEEWEPNHKRVCKM